MASLKLAMQIDAYNPIVGDIFLTSKGQTRLTSSLSEEVQQLLYTRLLFFQGEWALDPTSGTPWLQSILGVKNSDANVSVILKRVISTTPGVARIISFSLNRNGRNIRPAFQVQLTDGATLRSSDFGPVVI